MNMVQASLSIGPSVLGATCQDQNQRAQRRTFPFQCQISFESWLLSESVGSMLDVSMNKLSQQLFYQEYYPEVALSSGREHQVDKNRMNGVASSVLLHNCPIHTFTHLFGGTYTPIWFNVWKAIVRFSTSLSAQDFSTICLRNI